MTSPSSLHRFGSLVAHVLSPPLLKLLSHPICVALLKTEMSRSHTVELLMFHLHVHRYRRLRNAAVRRVVASAMYDIFVGDCASQKINLRADQRTAIEVALARPNDLACTAELFHDAHREVLQLIETNVIKSLEGTPGMWLRCWLLACTPMAE